MRRAPLKLATVLAGRRSSINKKGERQKRNEQLEKENVTTRSIGKLK